MVRELQTPAPGSKPLFFKSHFSTGLLTQVGGSDPKAPPLLLFTVEKDTQPHVPHIVKQCSGKMWLHRESCSCLAYIFPCMQFTTCMAKNMMVYWRNTEYNAVRYMPLCRPLYAGNFLCFMIGVCRAVQHHSPCSTASEQAAHLARTCP